MNEFWIEWWWIVNEVNNSHFIHLTKETGIDQNNGFLFKNDILSSRMKTNNYWYIEDKGEWFDEFDYDYEYIDACKYYVEGHIIFALAWMIRIHNVVKYILHRDEWIM